MNNIDVYLTVEPKQAPSPLIPITEIPINSFFYLDSKMLKDVAAEIFVGTNVSTNQGRWASHEDYDFYDLAYLHSIERLKEYSMLTFYEYNLFTKTDVYMTFRTKLDFSAITFVKVPVPKREAMYRFGNKPYYLDRVH
ncbi:hypothetical protein DRQ26_02950 [bacterium]|nr:MAG: hypothetical protein DRQ26_02950 [bacterium]